MLNKNNIFIYLDRAILVCLCLLIFCLPFAKAAVEFSTLLAFILWILKRILGFRSEVFGRMLPQTGLSIALGIYILINASSVIFSVDQGLSLKAFFGKELKFLAIFFILVEVVNNKIRLRNVLITIIASATLIIIDSAVQYYRGVDFLRGHAWDRLTASFPTANGFAGWLIVIIPLFLGLLLAGNAINRRLKILLMVSTVLLTVCLLGTYARGAWLGFIVAIVLMFGYVFRGFDLKAKILCLSVIGCLLVTFIILPQPIRAKLTAIGRIDLKAGQTINARVKSTLKIEGSTPIRLNLWKEALRMIRDYNFIGCGLNTYSIVARDYKSFEGGGIYPHNSYLQKAAEIGLFGLAAFLAVLFMFFKISLQYFNQKKDYLVLGLLSGILAFLVQAFFDTHFYSLQLVVLFWFMMGLTMAVVKIGALNEGNV